MKKLSGTLKLDLAQYRELEAFAKLVQIWILQLKHSLEEVKEPRELLKKDQYQPLPVEQEIVLKVNNAGLLDKLSVSSISEFQPQYLEQLTQNIQMKW